MLETKPDLFSGPWTVTGNVGKVRVLLDLERRLQQSGALRILDVGCVGLQPLAFWEPILARSDVDLTGVDVHGIDRARQVAEQRGWSVRLHEGSGYDLVRLFQPDAFDIIVANQVLEHVARPDRFLRQVATVLRPGGEAFFVFDSAEYRSRFTPRLPVRLAKNIVKATLALIHRERHYDLPWSGQEIARACAGAGLDVEDTRHCNLLPVKWLHNHAVAEEDKNSVLRAWWTLEEALADAKEARAESFAGIYMRVRKP